MTNTGGVGERGFDQVVTKLHQLTGPITSACDRYMTNTGGGYSLEGADFPHSTPQPFQLTVLPFLAKGPAQSLDYPKSNTGSKVQV
jgi:hypothetical protein